MRLITQSDYMLNKTFFDEEIKKGLEDVGLKGIGYKWFADIDATKCWGCYGGQAVFGISLKNFAKHELFKDFELKGNSFEVLYFNINLVNNETYTLTFTEYTPPKICKSSITRYLYNKEKTLYNDYCHYYVKNKKMADILKDLAFRLNVIKELNKLLIPAKETIKKLDDELENRQLQIKNYKEKVLAQAKKKVDILKEFK